MYTLTLRAFSIAVLNFVLCVITSYAQTAFQQTYGGTSDEHSYSVQQTSDGGYIIVGDSYSFGAGFQDIYLLKTNSDGTLEWSNTFGGTNSDYGYSVQQTSDGGYIVAGYTRNFGAGNSDVYLLKAASDGSLLWTKTFGGAGNEQGESIDITSDGGFIVTGFTTSYGTGFQEVYLVKTTSDGTLQWTKTYGGTVYNEGASVQQTSDGGYIIAGNTDSFGTTGYNVYVLKTSSDGTLQWTKTFGGTADDRANAVRQTSDGGYIIAGYTNSFGAGSADVYLIKTNSVGNIGVGIGWTKTFGGSVQDIGNTVQQTSDGGFIVSGSTTSFGLAYRDAYVVKTASDGTFQWAQTYGGSGGFGDDYGYAIQQTIDGGYIISGNTESFGAGLDWNVYLVKTDASGNVPCYNITPPAPATSSGATTGSGGASSSGGASGSGGLSNTAPTVSSIICSGVLPIKILSFTASEIDDSIVLQWNTALDPNNDYFNIEKSSDGKAFAEIGTMKGAGNSTQTNLYTFTDKNPFQAINYYRLKQVDVDGNFAYSKVITVTIVHSGNVEVTISPNLLSTSATLQVNNLDGFSNVELKIYDLLGRVVFKSEIVNPNSEIKKSTMQNGIYFYEVKDKYKSIGTGKLIIQ